MASQGQKLEPLLSEFVDDPEFADLIELFIDGLSEKVVAIEQAVSTSDVDAIRTTAHQLKGAAGGYGFSIITEAAAALEESAKNQDELQRIAAGAAELVALCRRAQAGEAETREA